MKSTFRVFWACLFACSLAMCVTSARATVITYIDATSGAGGNTTRIDGSQFDPVSPFGTQGPANEGLWDARAFGNNATVFQNGGNGVTDDAHRLLTTMSGLTPGGSYNVYAYFWRDQSSWRMSAGLSESSMILYTGTPASEPGVTLLGPTNTDANPTPNPFSVTAAFTPFQGGTAPGWETDITFTNSSVQIAHDRRRLFQAYLGPASADANGQIGVYIDDETNSGGNTRTWYDGVGYSAVVPEPASLALLGISLVSIAFRRVN